MKNSTVSYSDLPAFTNKTVLQETMTVPADIERMTLLAMTAVTRWRVLLSTQPENGEKETTRAYLATLGYLPEDSRIVGSATRSTKSVEETSLQLLQQLHDGTMSPEDLAESEPEHMLKEYGLSKSRVQVLQSIVRHEIWLGTVDISDLVSQFPFPITQQNLFGRFIAGGCNNPDKAQRHLKLTTPFFIRMASLLEGLGNERKRFLIVSHHGTFDGQEEERPDARKTHSAPFFDMHHGDINQIITSCIDHSDDLWGQDPNAKKAKHPSYACIQVPKMSGIDMDHVKPEDRTRFTEQIYEWIFSGGEAGDLLQERGVPITAEVNYRKNIRLLERKKSALKRMKEKKPAKDASKSDHDLWTQHVRALEVEIRTVEKDIRAFKEFSRYIRTPLQNLESSARVSSDIAKFRRAVAAAKEARKHIVFSSLPVDEREKEDFSNLTFMRFVDRAYVSKSDAESVQTLQQASFLMTPGQAKWLSDNRAGGWNSAVWQQLRPFQIQLGEINPSLALIASDIQTERKMQPELVRLLGHILQDFSIPGVMKTEELSYLVQQANGNVKPSVDHYLEYVFRHSAAVSQEQLMRLLGILREIGFPTLPDRCKKLACERFELPAQVIDQFAVYNTSYKPTKVGPLPPMFEDLATLEGYQSLHLDAFGMSAEVREIERHLRESGIVTIVDSTEYHPELAKDIADEKVKAQSEVTDEVWGQYVRPSERLIRAFALKLMEGDVGEELRNSTLVGVQQPSKMDKIWERLYKKFLGIDLNLTPDLSSINQLLSSLTVHDDSTVLVVNAENVKDMKQYGQFVKLLQKYRLKVILRMRESLPGVSSVIIQPFLDHEIESRLREEEPSLRRKCELTQPISPEVMRFVTAQVKTMRKPNDDPLNLGLQVIHAASQNAKMLGSDTLTEQDVVAALAPIFHLPDGAQMRKRLGSIDAFVERAPLEVLGQEKAISKIGSRMKSHILGLRDASRPLTLLIPGPTGVGKTELMLRLALAVNIPFFMIEGAEYSESHTVSRLVGSPTGYVGPDQGVLFKFLKDNPIGLTFVDEIEKMHPDVYQALMNFFDKATLTAGDGTSVRRPGHIIVGASNAGAEKLSRDMTDRELRKVLSESFRDRQNKPRPELVARFDPVMMLALEAPDFGRLLRSSIEQIGSRYGFINANLRLAGVDDQAVQLLYEDSRDVCAYDERSLRKKVGFDGTQTEATKGTARIDDVSEIFQTNELFYDMRHVSRALDTLAGSSLQQIAEQQFSDGSYSRRGQPTKVRLVGDLGSHIIRVEQIPEEAAG